MMISEGPLVEYNRETVALLDTLEDLYFETDLRGRFVFLNEACRAITGFTKEDLLGRTYQAILDEDTASMVFGVFNRVYKTGTHVRHFKYQITRKDGSKASVSSSISLVRDKAGNRLGFRGIIRDITEQNELQQRLEKSEEIYKALFETSATALAVIGPDGTISLINPHAEILLGETKENVEQKIKWKELCHEDDFPILYSAWQESIRKGEITSRTYQIRVKTRRGYRWAYMSAGFLPQMKSVIASLIDITDRVMAEEELRQKELSFRMALDASPIPIIMYDKGLNPMFINSAFEKTFGCTIEQLKNKELEDLPHIPPELKDEPRQLVKEVYEKGILKEVRTKRRNSKGELIDVLLSGAAFKDALGQPLGLIVFLMDISERERAESQLRHFHKMEALGSVTSGVAHDFNNILQAIYGFAQVMLIKRSEDDPDYRRLKAIEANCERARDLIQNLLIFSRKAEATLKPVNLNRELKQFMPTLERLLPKTIRIEICLSPDLHLINGDTTQLQQMIINMSVNARDAMPDGGTLTFETKNVYIDEQYCRLHMGFEPGVYVILAISDTGIGIPKEIVDKIFDPFFTTKPPGKGTGLGLSTVYGIIKKHNGHINCYSIPGVGTTFKIYFPALVSAEKEEQIKTSNNKIVYGKGETILVIDDEATIQEFLQDTLKRANYNVISAMTGEEGLKVYQNEKIDLVILDLNMPGMGGLRCFKEMKIIDPGVKVIIASGYALNGQVKKELGEPMIPYLLKPFDFESLLKTIRSLLDG